MEEKSVRKRWRQQRSNAAVDESYANNDNWESLMLLHTTQRWKPQLAHAKVALTADFTVTGEAFTDSRLYSRFPLPNTFRKHLHRRSFIRRAELAYVHCDTAGAQLPVERRRDRTQHAVVRKANFLSYN